MLKQAVKQYLKRKCDARYENELHEKSDIYAVWYKYHLQDLDRQLVEKDHTRGKAFRVEVVRYSHLRSYILSGKVDCDIIIACEDDGTAGPWRRDTDPRLLCGKSAGQYGLRR